MTRAQQTVSLGLLVTSVYLALFLQIVPVGTKIQDEIVPVVSLELPIQLLHTCKDSTDWHSQQLPFWALVSFGSYLLFKLGWGVFAFNDVPAAYQELMGEIDMARKELKKNGIDVD
ncbi:MAG: hypothetical protein HETSPECPRED_008711 [Heterodermia speciosa]|uniref:Dolichol-phosphate mannosyltransferase subunit 3 n=1 Tax=Heterodermia speciosa TaxID=116794 RepID=A0A8H3FZP5_9LECA|nr:MAG: hypothetical protein HETSPECPRED_008711 [Heterodermia speciosa]